MRLSPLLAALGLGTVLVALVVGGPWWPTAVAGGLLLLLASAYSRSDGLLLLGPFARWQLVRTARRGRLFSARVLVAGVTILLCAGAIQSYLGVDDEPYLLSVPGRRVPQFAQVTCAVLIGMIVFITAIRAVFTLPAVVAEEREGKRLDHLLVTDLKSHEILLGKTAGLVAPMAAETVVPIPLLVLLAAHGGIDPVYLAAALVLGGGLLLGTLGVAVGCTARSRNVGIATGRTVAVLLVLFFGTLGLSYLMSRVGGLLPIPAGWLIELNRVVDLLIAGNPALFIGQLTTAGSARSVADQLDIVGRPFLAWHLFALAVGWWTAVRRLRPRPVRRPIPSQVRRLDRPTEPVRRRVPWWALPAGLAVILAAVGVRSGQDLGWLLEYLFRASGPVAFFFVTLPVGWAAVRRLPLERQRDTLDPLLLTAMTPGEIVRRAWRQGVRAAVVPIGLLGVVYAFVLAYAYLYGPAVGTKSAILVGVVAANAAANVVLAASLGVLVSIPFANARRATGVLFLVGLYWCAAWFGWWMSKDSPADEWRFLAFVPPVAQCFASTADSNSYYGRVMLVNTIGSVVAAGLMLTAACVWFRRRVRPTPEAPA